MPAEIMQGGGESLGQLQSRVAAALTGLALQHPSHMLAVVAHGGFLHAAYRCFVIIKTGDSARGLHRMHQLIID